MRMNRIIVGDCRRTLRRLPSGVVHCVVTSPPYWGLRDYQEDDQIGLEETPEDFVEGMVSLFREVRRVLRDDGVVFLNLGDSYCSDDGCDRSGDLKAKDLCGIPWMVALALRADGWYLRSDVIWSKPNPMPESCTDRPTRCHEYVFLLTKKSDYFFDFVAVQEPATMQKPGNKMTSWGNNQTADRKDAEGLVEIRRGIPGDACETKNCRTVWTINTHPFKGAHFATYPPKLVERCVRAGTSQKGCCPKCGAPWTRKFERERTATRPGTDTKVDGRDRDEVGNRDPERHITRIKTLGWEPGCGHGLEPVGCVVLDPFMGSGTTAVVCKKLKRRWLGLELNPEYADMAERRIGQTNVGLGLVV